MLLKGPANLLDYEEPSAMPKFDGTGIGAKCGSVKSDAKDYTAVPGGLTRMKNVSLVFSRMT